MSANPFWGDDWDEVRALWSLDPDVAHCNHGSYGAVPTSVLQLQNDFRARMAANPMRWFGRDMPALVAAARLEIARFLSAEPEDIAFVSNVSAGVSAVAQSLSLAAGDEIVSTNHIYGAVSYALDRLSARTGACRVVVEIPLEAGDKEVVELVSARLNERTALVVVDQITSGTARRFPIAAITAAAHGVDAAVLVDGAHAPGMLPLDVPTIGADFWAGNLHKWPCTPAGTGVLWVAPRWQKEMRSLVVSWQELDGFPASFDVVGTNDLSAWLAAPDALRLLGELGWDRLRSHNETLVGWAQTTVAEMIGTAGSRLRHDPGLSMAIVPLPEGRITGDEQAKALQRHLASLGVEMAVSAWTGGTIRLSAHAYNRPADYERLGAAVRDYLAS